MVPMQLYSRVMVVLFAGLTLSVYTAAQNPQRSDSQVDLRVDVRLVNVVATVTDSNGRYVNGLSAQDFVVEEDGVPQEIVHFTHDRDVPVSVGLVIDTSGSMDRKIRTAIQAVDRFIRTLHADDDIFLMTFSGEPSLRQDFTPDRNRVKRALEGIRVIGGTALYDALEAALHKIQSGRHDKRAILLITDGDDTGSSATLEQTLGLVRKSELLVYALGISAVTYADRAEHVPFTLPTTGGTLPRRVPVLSRRDAVDMNVLRELADSSGGSAFLLSDSVVGGRENEIGKILQQIADELRSQYTLGYYPSRPSGGEYRKITVRTRTQHDVRARQGYTAPK